jgi:hypothetical protein
MTRTKFFGTFITVACMRVISSAILAFVSSDTQPMLSDSGVQRHSCYLLLQEISRLSMSISQRDQRERIDGADQLLVHQFLDSEPRKLLAVARPADSTGRHVAMPTEG